MKTSTLLFVPILFLPLLGFGQSYEPFISESKLWTYVQTVYLTENGTFYLVDEGYFNGDTLWNDTVYHKYYKQQVQPYLEDTQLAYFFREDTVEQKVYVHDLTFNKTALLYDFSLSEGDSFNIYKPYDDFQKKRKVVQVDTLEDANKKLKRIIFDNGATWVEGIGSVTQASLPSAGELICVEDNGEVLYMNSNFSSCDTIFPQSSNGIEEEKLSSSFYVYPNPVDASSVIKVTSKTQQTLQIEIFNDLGILVRKDRFVDPYPVGLLHLEIGVYVFRLIGDDRVIGNGKFVVNSNY